jgi:hypothetical protein
MIYGNHMNDIFMATSEAVPPHCYPCWSWIPCRGRFPPSWRTFHNWSTFECEDITRTRLEFNKNKSLPWAKPEWSGFLLEVISKVIFLSLIPNLVHMTVSHCLIWSHFHLGATCISQQTFSYGGPLSRSSWWCLQTIAKLTHISYLTRVYGG